LSLYNKRIIHLQ